MGTHQDFPGGSDGKASIYNVGDQGSILGREDPLEKEMAPHSRAIIRKIPWMRSLVGYSPWGCKESDTTEQLHFLSFSGHTLCWMWEAQKWIMLAPVLYAGTCIILAFRDSSGYFCICYLV